MLETSDGLWRTWQKNARTCWHLHILDDALMRPTPQGRKQMAERRHCFSRSGNNCEPLRIIGRNFPSRKF